MGRPGGRAILFWVLFLVPLACGRSGPEQGPLTSLLPGGSDLQGWTVAGEPQTAEGEDLFLLINGGAELFSEYGFRRAVIQSYLRGDRSVNLEIYEMEDPESAFGIYSQRAGGPGGEVEFGNDASFEDYYLNFWKGQYLVTVVGFNTDPETREGILLLAGLVDGEVEEAGSPPALIRHLPPDPANDPTPWTVYFEGDLGLANTLDLASEVPFGMQHGVMGDYGDHAVFILAYRDAAEAEEWFSRISQELSASPRLRYATGEGRTFSARDENGAFFRLRLVPGHVLVYRGRDAGEGTDLLEGIGEALTS